MNKITSNCTVCNNSFFVRDPARPHSPRCPLLLACGHSACSQCLSGAAGLSLQISCKVCDIPINLTAKEDVDKTFPVNFYLLGLLVFKQAQNERDDHQIQFVPAGTSLSRHQRPSLAVLPMANKTSMCCECSVQAASCSCEKCAEVYCHSCFSKIHSVGKSLRLHRKILLTEGVRSSSSSFRLGGCESHPENLCSFYCEQDNAVVCPSCAVLKHNGHNLVEMANKNKQLVPQVQTATSHVSKVLKRLVGAQKRLQEYNPRSDVEKLAVVQLGVAQHFAHLHGWLQNKEASLAARLEAARHGGLQDLEAMSKEVGEQVDTLQRLLQEAQSALEPSCLPNVDLAAVLKKLNEMTSLPCQLTLPENAESLDAKFETIEVVPTLEQHCRLEVSDPGLPTLISLLPEELDEAEEMEDISSGEDELNSSEDISGESSLSSTRCLMSSIARVSARGKLSLPSSSGPSPQLVRGAPGPSSVADTLARRVCAKLQVGSMELVVISHISNPSDFYLQRKADVHLIRQLSKDIKVASIGSKPYLEPKTGFMCLVHYELDNSWYRGRIRSVQKDIQGEMEFEVFYIDYGNSDRVKASKLKQIPPSLCTLPPMCLHCSLINIEPANGQWSPDAVKVFLEMTTRPKLQVQVKGIQGDLLQVDLMLLSNDNIACYQPQSVRDTLVFLDLGHLQAPISPDVLRSRLLHSERQYLKSHYDLKPFCSLEVTVSHVNSPHWFFVQRLGEYATHLSQMMANLNTLYSSNDRTLKIYSPQIGMPVVAKYSHDGCWYRGIVVGLPEKRKVAVMYVDYGNTAVVDWFDVKKLHDKFMQLDTQAICCRLSDVQVEFGKTEWSEEASNFLRSLTYRKTLRLVVDRRSSEECEVTLYETIGNEEHCLNAKFVKAGFGRSSGKSASALVYKRANTQTSASSGSEAKKKVTAALSLAPALAKVQGRKFLETAPAIRDNPTVPVEASLAYYPPPAPPPVTKEPLLVDPYRMQVEVVTHNSPGEIYVRIMSLESQLENMMEELQKFYQEQTSTERNWSKEEFCAVQRPSDQQWFRGVVLDVSETTVKVFLVDLADALEVDPSLLHPLAPQFSQQLHGAIKCHLAGIRAAGDRDDVWPLLAGELLAELIDSYSSIYITKKGNIEGTSLPVEMWVEQLTEGGALKPELTKWVTFNQMLVNKGVAIPIKGTDTVSLGVPSSEVMQELQARFLSMLPSEQTFTGHCFSKAKSRGAASQVEPMVIDVEQELSLGCEWGGPQLPTKLKLKARATHVDDDGFIYLQELPNCERALSKIQRVVQQHYEDSAQTSVDVTWCPDQICMARYHVDDKWYRARVLEIESDSTEELKVLFVDFGNSEMVPKSCLRKASHMPALPVQCFKCELANVEPLTEDGKWRTADLDLIHGSIVDKKCNVTLLEMPQEGLIVKIQRLVTELGRDIVEYLCDKNLCRCLSADDQEDAEPQFSTLFERGETSQQSSQEVEVLKEVEGKPATCQVITLSDSSATRQVITLSDTDDEDLTYTVEDVVMSDSEQLTVKKEVNVADPEERYTYTSMPINTLAAVEVTVVMTPKDVYIKPLTSSILNNMVVPKKDPLKALQEEMNKKAASMPLLKNPVPGQACCALYLSDKDWYRAVISEITEGGSKAIVIYVDYGNVEELPISELHAMDSAWLGLPRQALRCEVEGVELVKGYDPLLLENGIATALLSGAILARFKSNSPPYKVQLLKPDGETSVYEQLIEYDIIHIDTSKPQ